MNGFNHQHPAGQHFGKGHAEKALKADMKQTGRNALPACGNQSLKISGLHDKAKLRLAECGKTPWQTAGKGIDGQAALICGIGQHNR